MTQTDTETGEPVKSAERDQAASTLTTLRKGANTESDNSSDDNKSHKTSHTIIPNTNTSLSPPPVHQSPKSPTIPNFSVLSPKLSHTMNLANINNITNNAPDLPKIFNTSVVSNAAMNFQKSTSPKQGEYDSDNSTTSSTSKSRSSSSTISTNEGSSSSSSSSNSFNQDASRSNSNTFQKNEPTLCGSILGSHFDNMSFQQQSQVFYLWVDNLSQQQRKNVLEGLRRRIAFHEFILESEKKEQDNSDSIVQTLYNMKQATDSNKVQKNKLPPISLVYNSNPIEKKHEIIQEEVDPKKIEKRKRALKPNSKLLKQMVCSQCGTSNSPEWRKGPDGIKSLCNACGLRFSKKARKLNEDSKKDSHSGKEDRVESS